MKCFVIFLGCAALVSAAAAASTSCDELAICFAIDESGSVGRENFRSVLSFARTLISKFETERSSSLQHSYSAWTFATTSSEDKDMVSPLTENATYVRERLGKTTYEGGMTNMYAGVLRCSAELLKSSSKKRILILTSDGKPNSHQDGDPNALRSMTEILKRDQKVTIMTLATFGKGQSMDERRSLAAFLQTLSSGPSYSFEAQFDHIDPLVSDVKRMACRDAPPPPHSVAKIEQCREAAVCFAIEDTKEMGSLNFGSAVDFVRDSILSIAASTLASSYAVVTFNSDANVQISMQSDYNAIIKDLGLVGPSYENNGRDLYGALSKCRSEISSSSNKDRVIVMIGSQSATRRVSEANSLANDLKRQGYHIVAVNVLSTVVKSSQTLQYFRGLASTGNCFQSRTSRSLESQMPSIVERICKRVYTEPPSPPAPPATIYDNISPKGNETKCEQLAICFAIDESGSLGWENFFKATGFVKDVIEQVVTESSPLYPPYFAAWMFDRDSTGDDELGSMSPDYTSLLTSLDNAQYNGGQTNIMEAVLRCKEELGKVPDRTRALVLLSDGAANVFVNGTDAQLFDLAEDLNLNQVSLFTVALFRPSTTSQTRSKLLQYLGKLASGPNYVLSSNFDTLANKVAGLSDDLCNIQPDLLPNPTLTCECSAIPESGMCARPLSPSSSYCEVRKCGSGWACDAVAGTDSCEVRNVTGWVLTGAVGSNGLAPCQQTDIQQIFPTTTLAPKLP